MIYAKDIQPKAASLPIQTPDGWRLYLYAPWEDHPWIRVGWLDFPDREQARRHLTRTAKHLEIVSYTDEAKAHEPL